MARRTALALSVWYSLCDFVYGAGVLIQERSTLPQVTVQGNAFFAGANRFYIRGVDYQPGGDSAGKDPLADINACNRDIALFTQLGINAIRVYTVDNSANHDDCMASLSNAGIYVALDVNNPNYSLNRESPDAIRRSYNEVYLQSVFSTIDSFAKYDNTLMFFSGNEVISLNETWAAPYIKAVIRDMKQYIKSRNYRSIPVGYSATDTPDTNIQIANYVNCGPDNVRGDFTAFNDYSWCGPQDFATSSWANKTKSFQNYSIPLFLSEYGCTQVLPRTFTEIPVFYSDNMTPVYSGGLIYQYSLEGDAELQKTALVRISPDGSTATALADFDTVKTQFSNTPVPGDGGYKTSGSASACPKMDAIWQANTSLPIMPTGAGQYLTSGAGTPPGNKNGNSQWAGTPSPGFGPPMDQSAPGSGKKNSAAIGTSSSSLLSSLSIAVALVAAVFAFN